MGAGRLVTYPPRVWTVDVVARSGAPTAVCSACGPLTLSTAAPVPAAAVRGWRGEVLAHLARHAARDLTPAHLRTCQCGRRGCPWHRRHRGCCGPVTLALTRRPGARSWQLADACRQCCAAMPDTAPVPEPQPDQTRAASQNLRPHPQPALSPPEEDDHSPVWDHTDTTW